MHRISRLSSAPPLMPRERHRLAAKKLRKVGALAQGWRIRSKTMGPRPNVAQAASARPCFLDRQRTGSVANASLPVAHRAFSVATCHFLSQKWFQSGLGIRQDPEKTASE